MPSSWPPELYDADAVRWSLNALESGATTPEWGVHYIVEMREHARDLLIGAGGFTGPPHEKSVEIGYGIVPERRRRGYAREAVRAWVQKAFDEESVGKVIAHTLSGLTPSIGVLESCGFTFVGIGWDTQEPEAIQYALRREDYQRSPVESSQRAT